MKGEKSAKCVKSVFKSYSFVTKIKDYNSMFCQKTPIYQIGLNKGMGCHIILLLEGVFS